MVVGFLWSVDVFGEEVERFWFYESIGCKG